MNLVDFEKYYGGYNSGAFAAMSERYYSDDIVFEIQGIIKLDGKKAVVDWFGELSLAVKEVITPSNIVFGEDKVAVEAESQLTAKAAKFRKVKHD